MDYQTPPEKRARYDPGTILDSSQWSDEQNMADDLTAMDLEAGPSTRSIYNNYMLMRAPQYPKRYYGYKAVLRGTDTLNQYGPSWDLANAKQRESRLTNQYFGRGRYKRRRSFKPLGLYMKGKGMYLGYQGRGNYFKRMMNRQMNRTFAGRTPLGSLGKKIGRRALGAIEGAVAGQGSYSLNGSAPASNNLVAGGGLSVPTFGSSTDETGALTIQHSEFIKDIYGNEWTDANTITDPFVNDSIALNPGIGTTFPWLSQIAMNYEEYEFNQLMFCFKTRVGDNLQTDDGQVGTLLMFTDYNPNDKAKGTKQDMLQAYGTSVAKITDEDILHGIECDPSKIKGDAHKFIRTGTVSDLHDYDWGKFQIGVDNTPYSLRNKVIGELYVSYTVTLRKPRLFQSIGLGVSQDQFLAKTVTSDVANSATVTIGSLGQSEENTLGCKLEYHAASATALDLMLTFPGSLSGAIEIIAISDTASGTPKALISVNQTFGNVGLNKDLIRGGSHSDDTDPSFAAGNTTQSTDDKSILIAHLGLVMANKSTDNQVKLRWGPNGAGVADVLFLIRRYNTHDLDSAPVFKTGSGVVIS